MMAISPLIELSASASASTLVTRLLTEQICTAMR